MESSEWFNRQVFPFRRRGQTDAKPFGYFRVAIFVRGLLRLCRDGADR